MRRFVARTPGAVLLLVVFLSSVFVSGQTKSSGKPKRVARRTSSDATLKADRPSAIKINTSLPRDRKSPSLQQDASSGPSKPIEAANFKVMSHPREDRLVRGHSFEGDVRTLPQIPPQKFEQPEFEATEITPVPSPGASSSLQQISTATEPSAPVPAIPAPTPAKSFDGLDFANWGAGHPPDTNGDVGPTYYIQTINTSVGIYNKS